MPLLKGLSELLARHEVAPTTTISIGTTRTTDALIEVDGRQYTPGIRAGEVWCGRCGTGMPAESVKAHRCER